LPEDVKSRFLALHEENLALKESFKTSQEKLQKARQVSFTNLVGDSLQYVVQFIKSQDKLFKEQQATKAASGTLEDSEAFRAQVKILEDDLAMAKV
jgi:protein HOOK3